MGRAPRTYRVGDPEPGNDVDAVRAAGPAGGGVELWWKVPARERGGGNRWHCTDWRYPLPWDALLITSGELTEALPETLPAPAAATELYVDHFGVARGG